MLQWEYLFAVIPGLILFLYGIQHFSEEMLKIAGKRFSKILAKLTSNRLSSSLLGATVTAIVQSSTATTVIVIGLVNAGILSFSQSLGVIIGANVGTTLTAQLIAFKLTAFAPLFVLAGFVLSVVRWKYSFIGKPLFYFGLVFFSLNLLSIAIEPMRNDPEIVRLFSEHTDIYVLIAVGLLFTVLVQSSSVTTGVVVLLTGSGLIGLWQGIPIVMGANIGTTTTAMIASFRMDLFARRAAVAHLLFNLFGVIIFLPFLVPFIALISNIGGAPANMMANAHLLFNLITAVIFLILLKPFESLILWLIPGKEEQILFATKHIGEKLPEDNDEALKVVELEMRHLLNVTLRMYADSHSIIKSKSTGNFDRIIKLEELNDFLDDQISGALYNISKRPLSDIQARKALLLIRVSNTLESLGDAGKSVGFTAKNIVESRAPLQPESQKIIGDSYEILEENIRLLGKSIPFINKPTRQKMRSNDNALRELVNRGYERNLKVISEMAAEGGTITELLCSIETAGERVREIRKLLELYPK